MAKKKRTTKKNDIGILAYIVAGASFIPLCGVAFGIVAIIWGFLKIERGGKKIIIIGASGILFTIIIYSSLYFFGFVQRGGIYDDLRTQLAETQLSDLVKSIEFFHLQEGHYPNSLQELQENSSQPLFIYDSTDVHNSDPSRLFYYELDDSGEYYYLLSVGFDGTPFTDDDIFPSIEGQIENIGYRVKTN